MDTSSKIWILGKDIPGMKYIPWHTDEITSFSACDILIVDTTSLNAKSLQSMDLEKAELLFTEIKKRFNRGLEIVCIASETIKDSVDESSLDNYFWSPLCCNYSKTAPGSDIHITNRNSKFTKYVDKIKQFSMAMDVISSPESDLCSPAFVKNSFKSSFTMANFDPTQYEITVCKTEINSKSNDVLGGVFSSFSSGIGKMTLLPMLNTIDESIVEIFKALGITTSTLPPPWASDIDIPKINDITKQIKQIDKEINALNDKKSDMCNNLEELHNYKKLVYCTGHELEEIVKQSLNRIGFKVRNGKPGKDDLLFDFKDNDEYALCSIEVKGIKGNLKLDHLRQSDSWVIDHLQYDNIKAKGLIIANVFYDMGLKSRKKIELSLDNLEYAKSRNLCIMPSVVLLDLCRHVLNGKKLDIPRIEDCIADTAGIIDYTSLR